jgi:Fe-S cluster biogenesis protein NfuA
MSVAPRRSAHVERTSDAAVLRWVVHHPVLAAARPGRRHPPVDSPLGQFIADGSIATVAVRNGDVLIRTDDPARWRALAPLVQAALLDTLDQFDDGNAHWLLVADEVGDTPSLAEIQAIVDRSAGASMSLHGGSMVVTAVDATTVHLRADGACHGCHQTDDTLLLLIGPAVRAEFPDLVEIVVDQADDGQPVGAPTVRRVLTPRRISRTGNSSACH